MNAAGMTVRITDMSPRAKARIAGVFALLTIVLGGVGQSIQDRLVISGDAATTAANVLAHTPQLWAGFAAYLVEMACSIVATAVFYDLLKPASKSVSLLAALFGLVAITIKTMSRIFYITPLFVLGGADYLNGFTVEQLRALALLSFKVNAQGAGVSLVFFGFYAVLAGYLVIKSTFLPRLLGVLGIAGGLGWLTFLSPPLGLRLFPYVLTVALVASVAKILWLLVKGVDEGRWKEQASAATASIWG